MEKTMAITNKTRNQIRKWVSSSNCGDLIDEFLYVEIQRNSYMNKEISQLNSDNKKKKRGKKRNTVFGKFGNETIDEFKQYMLNYFMEDVPASRFPFTICDSIWKYVMEEIENYYDIWKMLIEYKEGIKLEEMNEDF